MLIGFRTISGCLLERDVHPIFDSTVQQNSVLNGLESSSLVLCSWFILSSLDHKQTSRRNQRWPFDAYPLEQPDKLAVLFEKNGSDGSLERRTIASNICFLGLK